MLVCGRPLKFLKESSSINTRAHSCVRMFITQASARFLQCADSDGNLSLELTWLPRAPGTSRIRALLWWPFLFLPPGGRSHRPLGWIENPGLSPAPGGHRPRPCRGTGLSKGHSPSFSLSMSLDASLQGHRVGRVGPLCADAGVNDGRARGRVSCAARCDCCFACFALRGGVFSGSARRRAGNDEGFRTTGQTQAADGRQRDSRGGRGVRSSRAGVKCVRDPRPPSQDGLRPSPAGLSRAGASSAHVLRGPAWQSPAVRPRHCLTV